MTTAPAKGADPAPGGDPVPAADSAAAGDRELRGALRHSGGRSAVILLCSLASAAASLAEPAVLGRSLDLLLSRDPDATRWVALCAALIVAEVLLDAATALLNGTVGARSTAWLRTRALGRLLGADPGRATARFAPGDLATRLTANATEAGTVPAAAAGALAAVLPPLGALVALVLIDPWTAAAFLLGVPLLVLLLRAFARSSSAAVGRYQHVQAAIADRLAEVLDGASTVAAAGTAGRERRRILADLPRLGAEGRAMWLVYGRAVARSGVLMPLLVCLVLAVGGVRLAAGHLGVGELVAASRYAALAAGIGAVAAVLATLVRGRAAARRTAGPATLPPVAHGPLTLPADGPGTLELRGVAVVRDGHRVLVALTLTVPGGATAAVVGRSGSGKSLLAAVAGRLTDPDEGRVLLDGVPLDRLTEGELRREVGHAFARPALFGPTVADAIAFGAERPDPEAVRAAARAAGADGFVQRLPYGYDTLLADAPLSGGERQRLGLARAFAHAGRLLVLDDAMSGLDTVTQREVERALAREVRPGTRLVIAHRLSTAIGADLVVWLDGGRIRATGPHRQLWRDPDYRAVFTGADQETQGQAR
ncbi:ATP-binding cassette domain-containing protein [Streptomyces lichenis]|uniref:ABC transporter ATP-binding protein/permease n=1 Tax=Streptomyces lichenis TaxID=2306967 RepID=A0ABT0IB90_9ACTN|nr:ABC transporter ATP-binding protein [Streptomyces lichenis]MCK8678591.1 ABC transporter ATP-binding protein/permease [Streptomyces lichenis]